MASTPVPVERKRNLSSPCDQADPKKTKAGPQYMYTMSAIDENTNDSNTEELGECSKVNLCTQDLDYISVILEKLFQQSFESRITVLVATVIEQVTAHMSDKIAAVKRENERENDALKARVATLEHKADAAEQYSRRNLLQVSGLPEEPNENTDQTVIGIAKDLGVDISIDEIDRSHRVGKPKTFASATASSPTARPRDIIVKFTSFRSRQKLLTRKSKLRSTGHRGVYINEDLTRTRSNILYEARRLVKLKHVSSVWSNDGTILVRDTNMKTSRVETMTDLANLKAALGLNT